MERYPHCGSESGWYRKSLVRQTESFTFDGQCYDVHGQYVEDRRIKRCVKCNKKITEKELDKY